MTCRSQVRGKHALAALDYCTAGEIACTALCLIEFSCVENCYTIISLSHGRQTYTATFSRKLAMADCSLV